MTKYIQGDFRQFSREERVLAMQVHLRKIQEDLRNGSDYWGALNDEIDELTQKMTAGRSSVHFDLQTFLELQVKFREDPEYRETVYSRIRGEKLKKPSKEKVADSEEQKEG